MAEQNDNNIILKVDVDNSSAVESIDQLNDKLKYWQDLQKSTTDPKQLADYNNKIKEIKGSIDQMNKSGNASPIKSFKQQLKEAKEEALKLAAAGKENTKEFAEAAKKIAELKDQQDILNRAVTGLDVGNRFQAVSKVAGLAANSVAGLTGVFTLMGVSAETANESIAKLQSLQAIIGLIDSFGDAGDFLKPFIQSLKTGNKVIKDGEDASKASAAATNLSTTATASNAVASKASATAIQSQTIAQRAGALASKGLAVAMNTIPFVIIITAITLLIGHFQDIKDAVLKFIPGLKQLGTLFTNLKNAVGDFLGFTSDATRALDKLQASVKRGNELIDQQIERLSAQGGKEADIYKLKKQRTEAELNLLRKKIEVEKKLTEEENEQFRKGKNDLIVLDIAEKKRLKDDADKKAKEQESKNKAAAAKAKAAADKIIADRKADEKKYADDLKAANKVIENENKSARDKEVNEVRQSYQDRFGLANKLGKDVSALTSAMNAEIAIKNKKFDEDEVKAKKEAADKLKEIANKKFKDSTDAKLIEIDNKTRPNENDTPDEARTKLEEKANALFNVRQSVFEQELAQLTGNNEAIRLLKAKHEQDITNDEEEYSNKRKEIAEKEKEFKRDVNNQIADLGIEFGSVLQNIDKKNKSLTIAGIAVEKAAAIAKIIMNTSAANAKAVAASPLTLGQPFVTLNTVSAGLGIASTLLAARNAFAELGGGSASGGAGQTLVAPTINSSVLKREENGSNQMSNAISQVNSTPARAYIVSTDLVTQAQKEAFAKRNSTI